MTTNKADVTGKTSGNRWYLSIMSPNTKGEKFAWLDPTSIYINGDAFHNLLRKAGKLCVDTDSVTFSNYSGRTQDMEMRKPAFATGTKVLLVDQWIETGGTMDGAIRLVQQQGGKIAGLVAIAMEDNEKTASYRKKFPCITAVLPDTDLQQQCNRQNLDSFASYDPSMVFPKIR